MSTSKVFMQQQTLTQRVELLTMLKHGYSNGIIRSYINQLLGVGYVEGKER